LRRIAAHFTQAGFDDLDLIFDMLFVKDNSQSGKVTRGMFKDFIFNDLKISTLTERDLDLVMKTHPGLSGKEILNRQDLKSVFEGPYKEAREVQAYEQSRQPEMTSYGSKQQQKIMK
jgi:hypothetical protein